jgi:hypothetical protein
MEEHDNVFFKFMLFCGTGFSRDGLYVAPSQYYPPLYSNFVLYFIIPTETLLEHAVFIHGHILYFIIPDGCDAIPGNAKKPVGAVAAPTGSLASLMIRLRFPTNV